jgi:hypothetical protein
MKLIIQFSIDRQTERQRQNAQIHGQTDIYTQTTDTLVKEGAGGSVVG